MKRISILLFAVWSMLAFNACTEDIDESNLYTFTGETIEDYLQNRSEQFSSFNYILERIGYDKILAAYGTYTCFAPSNDAVEAYIDSLWNDESNLELPHNGMVQPGLEGLTDSLCKDIALFHLLSTKVLSVNMGNGMTIKTMLGRDINTSLDSVSTCVTINRSARINTEGMDKELENGVLHEISHVITRSNNLVSGELETHSELSIFNQALKLTGLTDSLAVKSRSNYTVPSNLLDFYCPEVCELGFTIFAESDEVFQEKGINNIEDLIEYANKCYGNAAVSKNSEQKEGWYDYYRNNGLEVSTGTDYQSPQNALNMFVRYHILKTKVSYENLVISANEQSKVTLYEYYETMLPYTLMKVSRHEGKRIINRWYANNTLTDRVAELGTNTMHKMMKAGVEVAPQTQQIQALNGYILPIKDVLVYDWDVPNGVLNERLRFDVSGMFGEMMSNSFRQMDAEVIKALNGGKSGKDGNLGGDYIRIPNGLFDNLVIYNDENTRLYYLSGKGYTWSNYQADEFNCKGSYDFALRLPPIPEGTYELRIGYTAESARGMLQFYLGSSSKLTSMEALDIPLDMRHQPSTSSTPDEPDSKTGWCLWTDCDDRGVESDANMHNQGYMRGPLYYTYGGNSVARSLNKDLRRILTKRYFEQGEYWLRFKTVLDGDNWQFHLDYIELCPENVYNNSTYVEDMY